MSNRATAQGLIDAWLRGGPAGDRAREELLKAVFFFLRCSAKVPDIVHPNFWDEVVSNTVMRIRAAIPKPNVRTLNNPLKALVAHHLNLAAIDAWRKHTKRFSNRSAGDAALEKQVSDELWRSSPAAERALIRLEIWGAVRRLERGSDAQVFQIYLAVTKQLPVNVVATRLGVSANAISLRLTVLRPVLQDELVRMGYTPPGLSKKRRRSS